LRDQGVPNLAGPEYDMLLTQRSSLGGLATFALNWSNATTNTASATIPTFTQQV